MPPAIRVPTRIMIRPFHTLPDVSAIDTLRANMHRLFARQRCILIGGVALLIAVDPLRGG